jgi:hypothetical protein
LSIEYKETNKIITIKNGLKFINLSDEDGDENSINYFSLRGKILNIFLESSPRSFSINSAFNLNSKI